MECGGRDALALSSKGERAWLRGRMCLPAWKLRGQSTPHLPSLTLADATCNKQHPSEKNKERMGEMNG